MLYELISYDMIYVICIIYLPLSLSIYTYYTFSFICKTSKKLWKSTNISTTKKCARAVTRTTPEIQIQIQIVP